MNKPFPQSPAEWQTAVYEGFGLEVEDGRSAYAARKFPYNRLKQWLQATYTEGYHPDFVPALLRNVIGLVAWVYGGGGEPNWSQSDAQRLTYQSQLPQKRMGSGALIFDENGRVLLVQPSYKPSWEIPGGVVEKDESPKACCQREVLEELGIEVKIGRLLLVDYNAATDAKTESLMFIFEGDILSRPEIDKIQLPANELQSFDFFKPDQLPTKMTKSLKQRVEAAYKQAQTYANVYDENKLAVSLSSSKTKTANDHENDNELREGHGSVDSRMADQA